MSLYNMLFGVNAESPVLLAAIGLTAGGVPRFRDCYLNSDGEIVVYTRTGGGNRDYYGSEEECRSNYPEYFQDGGDCPNGPWNSDLEKNKYYLRDEDDDYDSTYAYFYFSVPPEYADDIKALSLGSETHTPSEKWKALIASFEATRTTS